MSFEYPPDRQEFWNDYVERVGWGIDSEFAYQNFLAEQNSIGKLFDLWADPNQDNWVQSAAYGAFWAELAAWGLEQDSFDWHAFRELYG